MLTLPYDRYSEKVYIDIIDTFINGENIALKMIENFEIKNNKPIRPYNWTNIRRNI